MGVFNTFQQIKQNVISKREAGKDPRAGNFKLKTLDDILNAFDPNAQFTVDVRNRLLDDLNRRLREQQSLLNSARTDKRKTKLQDRIRFLQRLIDIANSEAPSGTLPDTEPPRTPEPPPAPPPSSEPSPSGNTEPSGGGSGDTTEPDPRSSTTGIAPELIPFLFPGVNITPRDFRQLPDFRATKELAQNELSRRLAASGLLGSGAELSQSTDLQARIARQFADVARREAVQKQQFIEGQAERLSDLIKSIQDNATQLRQQDIELLNSAIAGINTALNAAGGNPEQVSQILGQATENLLNLFTNLFPQAEPIPSFAPKAVPPLVSKPNDTGEA